MNIELTDSERELVKWLFTENPYMEEVEFITNKFTDQSKSRVGISQMPIEGGPEVNMYFTTGLSGENVYICLCDGNKLEISNVLSNLEYGDGKGFCGSFGSVSTLIDNDYLKDNNCHGLVYLRVSTIPFLSSFKDQAILKNRQTNILLAVFISREEYEVFRTGGLENLLSFFRKNNKNIFSVAQKKWEEMGSEQN